MTDGMEIKAEMLEGGLFRQSRYLYAVSRLFEMFRFDPHILNQYASF
jgi:hypothetical protein